LKTRSIIHTNDVYGITINVLNIITINTTNLFTFLA